MITNKMLLIRNYRLNDLQKSMRCVEISKKGDKYPQKSLLGVAGTAICSDGADRRSDACNKNNKNQQNLKGAIEYVFKLIASISTELKRKKV